MTEKNDNTHMYCEDCGFWDIIESYCDNVVSNHYQHRINGKHPACEHFGFGPRQSCDVGDETDYIREDKICITLSDSDGNLIWEGFADSNGCILYHPDPPLYPHKDRGTSFCNKCKFYDVFGKYCCNKDSLNYGHMVMPKCPSCKEFIEREE